MRMDTLDWLSHLVAFDTTSRYSNLALIEFVEAELAKQNLTSHLTYNDKAQKANLFATIPGREGSVEGGVIFSGHTDVVPVDDQLWTNDPFTMTLEKDRVYGRGTCDMKGFIAAALSLIPDFKKLKLAQPVHFALSYDEEVGCHGAAVLIADLKARRVNPKACIVGEPSKMQPVIAHKGIQVFSCKVHGKAAHSSLTPEGCNAIDYAAELIQYIRKLADQLKKNGPFDHHFDVPFTTITTNTIKGGIADNIIPELCEFKFEFRNLPQVTPDNIFNQISEHVSKVLFPKMQRENRSDAITGIELQKLAAVPSFDSPTESAIYQLACEITGNKEIVKVAYATEAGLFQAAGIPTIICGPGSIEQAHRPDEYVSIEQLEQCRNFLLQIAQSFCKEG